MMFKEAVLLSFLLASSVEAQYLRDGRQLAKANEYGSDPQPRHEHRNLASISGHGGSTLGSWSDGIGGFNQGYTLPSWGGSSFGSSGRGGGMMRSHGSFTMPSHGSGMSFGSIDKYLNNNGYKHAFGNGFGKIQGSLVDIPATAVDAGIFSTLVAALGAAGLVGALAEPNGPFTVFAPNDDAFAALPDGLVECLLKPEYVDVLSSILLYHVASGEVLSSDLTNSMSIEMLNGGDVTIDLSDGVKVNGVTVLTPDVMASNGVIHVVEGVLVPPGTDVNGFIATCQAPALVDIPTTAVNAGIFSTLVAALGAADLVGALSAPNGPYTVFAPNDDAFAALPDGLVECLLKPEYVDVLSSILLFHVASGEALSSDLTNGMAIETLNGEDIMIDLRNGVKANGVSVIAPDVMASNGVIHVVEGVLVPPGTDVNGFIATCQAPALVDIPTTAVNAGIFSTLVAALGAADLVGALSAPNGPYTVFAPNDDAFAALPDGLVECLLKPEYVDVLSSILLFHVASGEALSSDLTNGMAIETLNGEDIMIDLRNGVKVNGVSVIAPDVMASNGVIHVVEGVLVPPGTDVGGFIATCQA